MCEKLNYGKLEYRNTSMMEWTIVASSRRRGKPTLVTNSFQPVPNFVIQMFVSTQSGQARRRWSAMSGAGYSQIRNPDFRCTQSGSSIRTPVSSRNPDVRFNSIWTSSMTTEQAHQQALIFSHFNYLKNGVFTE
jgi:hypothetical protein